MRANNEGWVIPAGDSLELLPGRHHIMFIGLEKDLVENEMQTITLEFAKAGKIEQVFLVKAVSEQHMHYGQDAGPHYQ